VFSDIAHDRTAVELAEAMRKDGWTVALDEDVASQVLYSATTTARDEVRPRFGWVMVGATFVWMVFFVVYGVNHGWEIPAKYYVHSALTVGLGSLIGFGLSVIAYRRKLAKRLDSDNNAPGKFPIG
jgi:bacteriorhodopsin